MAVEIWIPGSANEVVDRCKVPTPDGPCGHAFYKGESDLKKAQHFKICTHRNMESILAFRAQETAGRLGSFDPEYSEWLEDHAEGIAAGRVKW